VPTEGFIVLLRAIRDSWVWKLQPGQLKVWLQLLLDARWSHEEDKLQLPGQTIVVRRGQVWTTERTLALRAGAGRQVVRTTLRLLLQDGAISTQQLTRYGTLITITNYETYQDVPDRPNPPAHPVPTHPQPNKNQGNQGNQKTLLRVPKRTRGEWSPGFKSVREVYPQPRELKEAWQLWQKMKLENRAPLIRNWVVAYEQARQAWLNAGRPQNEQAFYSLPYLKRFLRRKLWEEPIRAQAKKLKPERRKADAAPNVLLDETEAPE
jgi:hypothetical protein